MESQGLMPYDVCSCSACDTQARSSSSIYIRDNRNWDREGQEEVLDRTKFSIKAVISFCALIEDVGDKQHLKLIVACTHDKSYQQHRFQERCSPLESSGQWSELRVNGAERIFLMEGFCHKLDSEFLSYLVFVGNSFEGCKISCSN